MKNLFIIFLMFLFLGCISISKPPDTEATCHISQPASHQANFKIILKNNNLEQATPTIEFQTPDPTTITINPSSITTGIIGAGETREIIVLVVAKATALKGNYAITAKISNFGPAKECRAIMTIT